MTIEEEKKGYVKIPEEKREESVRRYISATKKGMKTDNWEMP